MPTLDPLRRALSARLFSPWQGMTLDTWRAVLRAEGPGAVAPRYRARAAFQSAVSRFNALAARREAARYDDRLARVEVAPPLFILGHFRHGTTHLHNLLAVDPRFAYPTLYQTLYPQTFLTTEAVIARLGAPLLLRRRPHDNVAIGFGAPNEDELAVGAATGLSPYFAWTFPRRAAVHDRFLTLRDVRDDERSRWEAAIVRFFRALTLRHGGRPLVLKSPPHTARVRTLARIFPGARFVHIRRDPYAVFASSRHMAATTMRYWRLHDPDPRGPTEDDRILTTYHRMYDAFFDDVPALGAGRFAEVVYEDLERDPVGVMRSVYDALALGGFAAVEPRLRSYAQGLTGYRKNAHAPLAKPDRRRVAEAWGRNFEAWGYAR